MASIPSYRAEMIGLSDRDRMLLRSLLAATQARTGVRWDGDASQPAVQFVDIEGQAGAEFWQSLGNDARRDSIIVLAATAPAGAVRWLPKPLRSPSLIALLQEMTLPARPPAPLANVAATPIGARVAAVNAEPKNLLDVLEGPAVLGARVVQSPHWPDLVVGSGNTHAMRTAPMENYADGFVASIEISRIGKYTGGPINDEQRVEVDTLRWLALLYAPIEEIASRLPRPQRARLRKPPEFGHLPHKLHHVRMAAWLAQHPSSAQELADTIGVDEETVRRFFGACAALGLLEDAVEPATAMPIAAVAPFSAAPPAAAAPMSFIRQPVAPAATVVSAPVPAAETASEASVVASAEPVSAEPATPATMENGSVFERLRAAREQNRARVAAAIRTLRGSETSPPSPAPVTSPGADAEAPASPPDPMMSHAMT